MAQSKGSSRKHPRALRWVLLILFLLAAAGGGYYYYSTTAQQTDVTTQPTMQTATAQQGNLVIYASGTGTLVARANIALAFGAGGEVAQVHVKTGDKVSEVFLAAEKNLA